MKRRGSFDISYKETSIVTQTALTQHQHTSSCFKYIHSDFHWLPNLIQYLPPSVWRNDPPIFILVFIHTLFVATVSKPPHHHQIRNSIARSTPDAMRIIHQTIQVREFFRFSNRPPPRKRQVSCDNACQAPRTPEIEKQCYSMYRRRKKELSIHYRQIDSNAKCSKEQFVPSLEDVCTRTVAESERT